MTGKQLYELWVKNGLCTSSLYRWDQLSVTMQGRWIKLANDVNWFGK